MCMPGVSGANKIFEQLLGDIYASRRKKKKTNKVNSNDFNWQLRRSRLFLLKNERTNKQFNLFGIYLCFCFYANSNVTWKLFHVSGTNTWSKVNWFFNGFVPRFTIQFFFRSPCCDSRFQNRIIYRRITAWKLNEERESLSTHYVKLLWLLIATYALRAV